MKEVSVVLAKIRRNWHLDRLPAAGSRITWKELKGQAPILCILSIIASLSLAGIGAAWIVLRTPEGMRVYWGFELMPLLIPPIVIFAGIGLFFFIVSMLGRKDRKDRHVGADGEGAGVKP
jgi:ABC-type spermidine/putrescine transport system permease subunit II